MTYVKYVRMTSVVQDCNTRSIHTGHNTILILLAVSLQPNAHGKCCVELMVACATNYQPLRMMECLRCEMEVVCGQEGPMTELTIISFSPVLYSMAYINHST